MQLGPFQPGPQYKRGRGRSFFREPPKKGAICQVPGCGASLNKLKAYYQRYKICAHHMELQCMAVEGQHIRFCQQCGRYQLLREFSGDRRTCRSKLAKHNTRRRKVEPKQGFKDSCDGSELQRPRRHCSGDSSDTEDREEEQQEEEEVQRGSSGGSNGGSQGIRAPARGRSSRAGPGGRGGSRGPPASSVGLGDADQALSNLLSYVAWDQEMQGQVSPLALEGLKGVQGLSALPMGRGGGGSGLLPSALLPPEPEWLPGLQPWAGPDKPTGPGGHPAAGGYPVVGLHLGGPDASPPTHVQQHQHQHQQQQSQQQHQQMFWLGPGLGCPADALMGRTELSASQDPGLLPYLPPQQQQQQQAAAGPGARARLVEMLDTLQAGLLQVGPPPLPPPQQQQQQQQQSPMLVAPLPRNGASSKGGAEAGGPTLWGRPWPGVGGGKNLDGCGVDPWALEALRSSGVTFRQQLPAEVVSLLAVQRALEAAEGGGGHSHGSGVQQPQLGSRAGLQAPALWLQCSGERSAHSGTHTEYSFPVMGGTGWPIGWQEGPEVQAAALAAAGAALHWARQERCGGMGGAPLPWIAAVAPAGAAGGAGTAAAGAAGHEGPLRSVDLPSSLPLAVRVALEEEQACAARSPQHAPRAPMPFYTPASWRQQLQQQEQEQQEQAVMRRQQWLRTQAGANAEFSQSAVLLAATVPSFEMNAAPIPRSSFEAAMLGYGLASMQAEGMGDSRS